MTTAAYDAMARVSRELALPTRYATDLHWSDRAALERLADAAGNVPDVGWALHAYGTHLLIPGDPEGRCFPRYIERSMGPDVRWYWWCSATRHLEAVDRATLEERLAASRGGSQ